MSRYTGGQNKVNPENLGLKTSNTKHNLGDPKSKHELFHKLSVFINPFKTIKHMTNMRSPNSLQKTITVFINLIKTIKHI